MIFLTIKKLENLRWLKKEIDYYAEKVKEIRLSLGVLSAQNFNGLPSGGQKLSQPVRDIERLEKLERLYLQKRETYEKELLECQSFIESIDDSLVRQIITLRFAEGKQWKRIAFEVGGNTEDSVRKTCERYLKSVGVI